MARATARFAGAWPRAECGDLLPERRHAGAGGRLGLDDRRPPVAGFERLQREVGGNRLRQPVGPLAVRLVDDEDVGDFHDAGLERLDLVAGAGHQHDDGDIGGADDVNLVLPDADRFDDDDLLPRRIEHQRRVAGRARESAEMPAGRHAADEHAVIAGMGAHAYAIAKHGTAGERAGGIDGNHAHRHPGPAHLRDQAIDERALAGTRRAGDADQIGVAGARVDAADDVDPGGRLVLDEGDGPRHRTRIPREHAVGQRRFSWQGADAR